MISGTAESVRGLSFAFALVIFGYASANIVSVCYSVLIFKRTGVLLDPYIGTIILAVAMIIGSLCSTYLVENLGRKWLNFISLAGSAIGLFALTTFQYLNDNGYDLSEYAWFPVACLSFIVFISAAGIMTLMFVCSIEYIPAKVKVRTKQKNLPKSNYILHR